MKFQRDLLHTACAKQEETSYHFLERCYANILARNSTFGAYLMGDQGTTKVEPSTFMVKNL